MEVNSPSTSFTVSSPRRTLSLLKRERRAVSAAPAPVQGRDRGPSGEHGPNPSEVYGFVGAISTVISTAVILVWAYIPEPWLHDLGITYYPNKYWALAVPAYVMVTIILAMGFYLGLNFISSPSPTSFATLFDEHTRERSTHMASDDGREQLIEPISDIGVDEVNARMFGLNCRD